MGKHDPEGAGLVDMFAGPVREAVRRNRVEALFLLLMGLAACLVVVIVAARLEGIQLLVCGSSTLAFMVIAGVVVLRRRPTTAPTTDRHFHIDPNTTISLVPTRSLPDPPLEHAAPNEDLYAIGRTLKYWGDPARIARLRSAIAARVRMRFLMMDPLTDASHLPQQERDIIERDYQPSLDALAPLSTPLDERSECDLHLTTDLIHDSMRSMLVQTSEGLHHEITIDINTNAKRSPQSQHIEKLTLLIRGNSASALCRRLRSRAATLFEAGGSYLHKASGQLTPVLSQIREHLAKDPYDPSRKNAMASLFSQGRVTGILDAFDARRRKLIRLPRSIRPIVTPAPLCVHIEITDDCGPCRCATCGRHAWTAPQQMPIDVFQKLVMSLANIGTRSVVLSGGEPFEHPDIAKILSACTAVGLRVGVLSNGIGLRRFLSDSGTCEAHLQLLLRTCDWIRVSVDGATEEQFVAVRRPAVEAPPGGWLETVISSLRQLRAARGPLKGPQLDACFTLCRRNAEHFTNMVDLYRKDPDVVDACYFKFAHGSHLRNEAPTLVDVERVYKKARQLLDCTDSTDTHVGRNRRDGRHHGMNLDFLVDFVERCGHASIESGSPLRSAEPTKCFVPFMFSFVDAGGYVYPCCHLYRDNHPHRAPQEESMGDVSAERFDIVWLGEKYEEFRQRCATADWRCPAAGECTRHYYPNRCLDWLYDNYYSEVCRTSWVEIDAALSEDAAATGAQESVFF